MCNLASAGDAERANGAYSGFVTMRIDNYSTLDISAFTWSSFARVLTFNEKVEYGWYPHNVWVRGKRGSVAFVNEGKKGEDYVKGGVFFRYVTHDGDIFQPVEDIKLFIPWDRKPL
jgi:hypothetical protein